MSTTGRSFRMPGDTDDVAGTSRGHATVPRRTLLQRIVATDQSSAAAVARLALGLVIFPHAAQKVFGWFGGHGFAATHEAFTGQLGIPGWLAALAIIVELVSSILLIVGAFTRLAAIGIAAVMVGAIVIVHAKVGFFMNWTGTQGGEGFEYHLLALGLAVVCMVSGGGTGSVDRALTLRRPMEGGGMMEPVTRD
jgi:putative oxidoreductase